jgi:hypothetical protein
MTAPTPQPDRREFFRAVARAGLGGGLAVLAAVLLARRESWDCRRPSCRRCPVLTRCELPRAEDEKRRTPTP